MELHWWPVVVSPRLDCKLAPCPMPKIDHGVLTLPPLGCGLWVVGA
jgi:hypothetical protein